MVRQWQELFYKNNLSAVRMYQPDFVKLAEAYGMRAIRVTDKDQVAGDIDRALAHPGPVLIDFQVEEYENVFPMVPPGASLQETVDSPYAATPVKANGRSKRARGDRGYTLMPSRPTHRTIVALVENKPGVLNRSPPSGASAASTSSRWRSATREIPGTVAHDLHGRRRQHDVEQVTKQLFKVIEVVKISDMTADDVVPASWLPQGVGDEGEPQRDHRDRRHLPRQDRRRRRRSLIVESPAPRTRSTPSSACCAVRLKELVRTGRIAMTRGATRPSSALSTSAGAPAARGEGKPKVGTSTGRPPVDGDWPAAGRAARAAAKETCLMPQMYYDKDADSACSRARRRRHRLRQPGPRPRA